MSYTAADCRRDKRSYKTSIRKCAIVSHSRTTVFVARTQELLLPMTTLLNGIKSNIPPSVHIARWCVGLEVARRTIWKLFIYTASSIVLKRVGRLSVCRYRTGQRRVRFNSSVIVVIVVIVIAVLVVGHSRALIKILYRRYTYYYLFLRHETKRGPASL